ncbi:bacterial surface protein [Paenibacillus yonginensis]|uniref:Bacterial surface protein n=2 Tax=Paenibacillus yonginensis TaxID=1462996 RepID=A0A1B1N1N0_9BACL|nr:bacterial surface protein [Paenibacillus yonginensis]
MLTGDPWKITSYPGGYDYYLNYYYKLKEEPDTPDPEVQCTVETGRELTDESPDPEVSAVIKADSRGNEAFDVLQGIPTSESLYGNVQAKEYLYKSKFVEHKGVCTYNITVSQHYDQKWTEMDGPPDANGKPTSQQHTDSKDVSKQYKVERPYSYWTVEGLEVYDIKEADLINYAFAGSGIKIMPTDYSPPIYSHMAMGQYTPAPAVDVTNPPKAAGKDVPDEDFQSDAEKAIDKVKVQNDSLIFNGTVVMNSMVSQESAPTPGQIPEPQQISRDVLYSTGNVIPISKTNKKDQPSSGTIYYDLMPVNVGGGADKSFPIYGINSVTVHTPVVNYSSITDDQAHNQKTVPNRQRAALILERPFTVRIPTSGQHVNYPGYGNRDYAKYFRTKQVRFPFDVYNESRTQFIPKDTWIDIPVNQLDTTFYLPVWVDEGDYQVYFRSIAENAPNDYEEQWEPDANLDLAHHIATDEVSVEVIGRLYDFEITDIADYNWETVFRTNLGSSQPRGLSYWIGQNGIDGDPRGNREPFSLSIHPGSNPLPGYKNVAIKTGYHFKFDFKTKGNMFGALDGIRITPTFYYVPKSGGAGFPVDLYYRTNSQPFVKIGSEEDQVHRYVILNDRLRNVPEEELEDTASYKYDHDGTGGFATKAQYEENYIDKYTKQKTPVGGYSLLLLPEQLRTLIGPKSNLPVSVDPQRANAAIQKWYGEYSLPADPYVVQAGTHLAEYGRTHGGLDEKSPIFLKDGYIIVNFNIETIQEGNLNAPHLQYIHAPMMAQFNRSQWQMEGFESQVSDPFGHLFKLNQGDVVFYHADQSSRDDFSAQVPQ